MTTTTTTVRAFRENDWYGFADCEEWDNGDQPLIRELDRGIAVADARGVYVTLYGLEEDGDLDWDTAADYVWFVDFPSQSLAQAILMTLPQTLTEEATQDVLKLDRIN